MMQRHHSTAVLKSPHGTARAAVIAMDSTTWINVGLFALAVASLLFYVIQANGMAAQAWRTRDAQDRLAVLSEDRNALVAQQSSMDDRAQLTALAAQAGMVPAGAVVYVVQDRPVAAR